MRRREFLVASGVGVAALTGVRRTFSVAGRLEARLLRGERVVGEQFVLDRTLVLPHPRFGYEVRECVFRPAPSLNGPAIDANSDRWAKEAPLGPMRPVFTYNMVTL